RRLEFRGRLADPREDDALWRHAGSERATQLAFRDDIGTGAETDKMAQDGKVRVRLDGVTDKRRIGSKGLGKATVEGSEPGGGIEVKGRADGRRDPRHGDVLDMQLAVAIGEEVTHWGRAAGRCWVHPAARSAHSVCRIRPTPR